MSFEQGLESFKESLNRRGHARGLAPSDVRLIKVLQGLKDQRDSDARKHKQDLADSVVLLEAKVIYLSKELDEVNHRLDEAIVNTNGIFETIANRIRGL